MQSHLEKKLNKYPLINILLFIYLFEYTKKNIIKINRNECDGRRREI